mmetsp:Transcript_4757/g.20345  ORF Transcript_4757/g.20345 Transcript_4757/m.20345 type:complete len:272 (-) Transcript_4757:175-990(-)
MCVGVFAGSFSSSERAYRPVGAPSGRRERAARCQAAPASAKSCPQARKLGAAEMLAGNTHGSSAACAREGRDTRRRMVRNAGRRAYRRLHDLRSAGMREGLTPMLSALSMMMDEGKACMPLMTTSSRRGAEPRQCANSHRPARLSGSEKSNPSRMACSQRVRRRGRTCSVARRMRGTARSGSTSAGAASLYRYARRLSPAAAGRPSRPTLSTPSSASDMPQAKAPRKNTDRAARTERWQGTSTPSPMRTAASAPSVQKSPHFGSKARSDRS